MSGPNDDGSEDYRLMGEMVDELRTTKANLVVVCAEVDRLHKMELSLEKWKMKAAKEDTRWTYFILDSIGRGLMPEDVGCPKKEV